MRLADLNTTTEYAYRPRSKYGPVMKIQVRDAAQLWCRPRRFRNPEAPDLVPAPGKRANTGDRYSDEIGVLVGYPGNPESFLAYPAKILSTWAEFETEATAENERSRREAQARQNKDRENARNAARLRQLQEKHPSFKLGHISSYQGSQDVPYTTLIALLEALPVQADV